MRTVAEMFAEMKKIADEEGYQFNPVKEELDGILPLSERLAGR